MLKACTLFHRAPGLTDEGYQHYWRTEHAALVKTMRQVRRYVQNHPLLSELRDGNQIYDGMVELWADDTDALRALGASEEYKVVVADEYKLGDRSRQKLVLTEETVIVDGKPSAGAVKRVEFLKRRDGVSPEEFQTYWTTTHARLVEALPGLRRYVQSKTKLSGYKPGREPEWDGIGLWWFDSEEDARKALGSPEFKAVSDDLAHFTDRGRTGTLLVRENVVVG